MNFSSLQSPPHSPLPAPMPLPSSSSSLTCCPELDLSVTLSPSPDTRQPQVKPRPQSQGGLSHPKTHTQGPPRRKKNTKVTFEEPLVVTVTPEPRITHLQQSMGGRTARHHVVRHPAEPHPAPSNQEPGCLERAGLNSTLALKAELQSLQGAEFNSRKTLQETLQKSERTKTQIHARATEVVNVSRSQQIFSSLISVRVEEDELLSRVLQDRLLLAPAPGPRGPDARPTDGPSLLLFRPPDLFRQKPLPPDEGPAPLKLQPAPRPAHSTFDLYRRQRCWEASP
ncbi:protein phosphatase 1 regulatory subunit 35 [Cololabis saira]|uniref:protein phosphatase 1 regulatory subunit 35 n=1 Tax=Cololabis saira TaxID=129043 RepID=UPI002AD2FC22|nr:protein phosphatase 1 regulatory subunit 35 [Cololabis saira]